MMRIISNVGAMYKTKDVHKNLEKFAKRFPEASDFCEFDKDLTIEQIKQGLPVTDKYSSDGTIYNDWSYYFDIDFDQDGMYIWFIERKED